MTLVASFLVLTVGFNNCSRSLNESPPPEATKGPDDNAGAGTDPSPTPEPKNSYLFVFLNGEKKDINGPLDVTVGDEISLEGEFDRISPNSIRTKFVMNTNCNYKKTIQDWSSQFFSSIKHTIEASDQSNCTTLSVWIREGSEANPWPLPTDYQVSVLLNVTNVAP